VNDVRVVIADDHLLTREGLRTVIDAQDGLEVVDAAFDLPSLMRAVDAHEPDVVITDIRMPPTGTDEGIQATTDLRRNRPEMGVIVLSQYADATHALAVIEDGSERRGYLLKERVLDANELVRAVRTVARGGSVIDPAVVDGLLTKKRRGSPLAGLTPRELDVLREMARGKTNAAIGSTLFISEKAVQNHINTIFTKLDLRIDKSAHRRVQPVLLYLNEG
jgi:DNA-binding NarL/FixJ family response regulator